MGDSPATPPAPGRRRRMRFRPILTVATATVLGAGAVVGATVASASAGHPDAVAAPAKASTAEYKVVAPTSSPIKHVVVLFDENESFDHYFGTYPYAANTDGTTFKAKPGTPKVNGLYNKITSSGPTGPLLTANANQYNPKRLTHSQALTCDQNHAYTPEQQAFDGGKMDKFVEYTETDTCTGQPILFGEPGLVMDYYDGNTVTGLWNYAQNYAMSDNNYDTQFGPSTPGALNVISGNTGGGYAVNPTTGAKTTAPTSVSALNSKGVGSIYGDLDPAYDDCSDSSHTSTSPVGVETGKNIGDLLNAKHVTWGWFQGGFAPTSTNSGRLRGLRRHARQHRRDRRGRLLAAPQPVRVLQVDVQPQAPAAVVRGDDRPDRPGQPPVRPVGLRHHAEGRQHAGRQLPEGGRVPGRPPGLLRPAGRAELPRQHGQRDRAVEVLEVHRDRHHL